MTSNAQKLAIKRIKEVILFRIVTLLFFLPLLTNCSSGNTKINNLLHQDLKGQQLEEALSIVKNEGLVCERLEHLESDVRFKTVTDGTLNQLRSYKCEYEESTNVGMCQKSSRLFILAQYGKVIKVTHGSSANACLWDH